MSNADEFYGDRLRIEHALEQHEAVETEKKELQKNLLDQYRVTVAGLRNFVAVQDQIIETQGAVIDRLSRNVPPETEEAKAARLAFEKDALEIQEGHFGSIPKSDNTN